MAPKHWALDLEEEFPDMSQNIQVDVLKIK